MSDTTHHQKKLTLHFRRFEMKYWISPVDRLKMRRYICQHFTPDPFSGRDGSYGVTSLYFDSPGLKFYHELEAGLKNRQKIRYRYYNSDQKQLFLEIKKKVDMVIFKDRCLVTAPASQLTKEFDFARKLWKLRPVMLVRYQREAWIGPGDLRVTFDRNLEAARVHGRTLGVTSWSRPFHGNPEIMELKFSGRFPAWLYRMIASFNLERQQISKYRIAIEQSSVL